MMSQNGISTKTTMTESAVERVLLKNPFEVKRYDLALTPDMERFVFDGTVSIAVNVVEENKTIFYLHTKELQLVSIEFVSAATTNNNKVLKPSHLSFDLEHNVTTFTFPESLPLGKAVIKIVYKGILNDQMAGWYRSNYRTTDGVSATMLSTQFEALDARRAFPCVDEPAVKAVFGVTMTLPANLTALSNMPELTVHHLPRGLKRVTFEDTPIMSTYLLAFCVGAFDFVSGTTAHGVHVRVYTPPGRSEHGRFSLQCGLRVLDFYDDFFGVPYPLPKLDMIAIPEFAMGAMENWGLVTYREVELLVDASKASPQQQQRVCIVVTHELAHQWFGNLVTMAWWDDLWLNEGFASFMENYAADFLFPEWKIWEQFVADTLASAMQLDALDSSHPIQVPIAHAEEVEEVFDAISYNKGASVVRMLHEVLGADMFRAGLRLYMQRHMYKNTETTDLWQALQDASGKPVRQLMRTWTEQKGFPLVRVVGEVWSSSGVLLTLRQSRFLADGSTPSSPSLWTVPILTGTTRTAQAETEAACSLHDTEELLVFVSLDNAEPTDWVKLNLGHVVPIITQYTPALFLRLVHGIRTRTLPAEDRAGLLLDSFALCKAGKMEIGELVQLLAAYKGELDATVWDAIAVVLTELNTVFGETPVADAFVAFAASLAGPAAAHYGWEPQESDGHLGRLARATAISLAGRFCKSDKDLVAAARSRFAKLVENPQSTTAVTSELRSTMLQIVARHGGSHEYSQLLSLYRSAVADIDRKQVMLAFGCIPDPKLRTAALEWGISKEVKLQDYFYPMRAVSHEDAAGQALMWDFFTSHFDQIHSLVATASPSLFDAAITAACEGFGTETRATEVEAFFATKTLPSNQRSIAQILENIRSNAKMLARVLQSDVARPQFWVSL